MWSWYQGLSYEGGKFSHLEGKSSVSGSRIFGCYFSGEDGTPLFVIGRGLPPPPPSRKRDHKHTNNFICKGKLSNNSEHVKTVIKIPINIRIMLKNLDEYKRNV